MGTIEQGRIVTVEKIAFFPPVLSASPLPPEQKQVHPLGIELGGVSLPQLEDCHQGAILTILSPQRPDFRETLWVTHAEAGSLLALAQLPNSNGIIPHLHEIEWALQIFRADGQERLAITEKPKTRAVPFPELGYSSLDGHLRLNRWEEARETRAWQIGGDQGAREVMVFSQFQFLVSHALSYRVSWPEISLEDFIQEGLIGIMKALDRFNPQKGRFITYVPFFIRRALQDCVLKSVPDINVSSTRFYEMVTLTRKENEILATNPQADLSDSEVERTIAQAMGITLTTLEKIRTQRARTFGRVGVPEPTDNSISKTENAALAHLEEQEALSVLASHLDTRELAVIALRLGLGGWKRHTLEEVGRFLGVGRKRVWQIEQKALEKLRQGLKKEDLY